MTDYTITATVHFDTESIQKEEEILDYAFWTVGKKYPLVSVTATDSGPSHNPSVTFHIMVEDDSPAGFMWAKRELDMACVRLVNRIGKIKGAKVIE